MNLEQIANTKGKQTPKFDQVTIDGKEGTLWYTKTAGEKDEEGRYPRIELSKPFSCIFLIKRTRLIKTGPKGIEGFTDEYADANEVVKYYVRDRISGALEQKDEAPAQELRDRYELKTEVIQYVRHKGTIMRLRAKGLSIAPNDAKNGYFDYIFGLGEGENIWTFATNINTTQTTTDNGTFYRMTFAKGDALTEKQIENVEDQMRDLYAKLTNYEATKNITEDKHTEIKALKADYPQEDINPDDIPF